MDYTLLQFFYTVSIVLRAAVRAQVSLAVLLGFTCLVAFVYFVYFYEQINESASHIVKSFNSTPVSNAFISILKTSSLPCSAENSDWQQCQSQSHQHRMVNGSAAANRLLMALHQLWNARTRVTWTAVLIVLFTQTTDTTIPWSALQANIQTCSATCSTNSHSTVTVQQPYMATYYNECTGGVDIKLGSHRPSINDKN